MMCYKRAWQNPIGLLCNITKTNKKQIYLHRAVHSVTSPVPSEEIEQ